MIRDLLSRCVPTLCAILLASAACGAEGDPIGGSAGLSLDGVRVGIGGVLKVGKWTPVVVDVTTSRPTTVQLVLQAPDPDGDLATLPHRPVRLQSAGRHELYGTFKTGRLESSLLVEVRENETPIASRRILLSPGDDAEQPTVLRQSAFLLAAVGRPAGFQADQFLRIADLKGFSDLPTDVDGYDGLDALAIAGKYDVDPQHDEALREWVQLGGHLVLSVGSDIDAYRASLLARWIPVPVLETPSRLHTLSGLESFSGSNTRVEFSGRVKAAQLRPTEGQVFVKGIDGPLVVRVPYGFGKVTVFGVDLDRAPLSNWEPIARVGRKVLLGSSAEGSVHTVSRREQLESTGITDLASQLHASQESFPAVRRFSRWTVMGLMIVYLLLIGPIDYLLVHRVLKKPHLTWITFPLMVVAAATASAWGASRSNGGQLRVNQLEIIDVDAATHAVRVQSWVTIYSPDSHRYKVDVHAADMGLEQGGNAAATPDGATRAPVPRVCWSSIPENAFSGMYRPAGFEITRPGYALEEGAAGIANLPISIWSTKGLATTWQCTAAAPLVESTLESAGYGHLSGTLTHRLPADITGWLLAHGSSVYFPPVEGYNLREPVLRPQQPWPQNWSNVTQRLLDGLLTGVTSAVDTASGEGIRLEKTPYDRLSLKTGEIVRMITFHQEAGGTGYTGLENNTLRALDFSDLLDLNRAVLIGRLEAPASRISINGTVVEPDRRATYVRIVLPVKKSGEVLKQLPNFEFEEEQAARQ